MSRPVVDLRSIHDNVLVRLQVLLRRPGRRSAAALLARGLTGVAGVGEEVVVRCGSCGGLRGVSLRHPSRNGDVCLDCNHGRVVRREEFYSVWLGRFSGEECAAMARAIWGTGHLDLP